MTLDTLDTIIGFIVVVLMLSLVITTLVQMIAWTVNLRGLNLSAAVNKLLRETSGLNPVTAGHLARAVLQHPTLTTFARRKVTAIRKQELLLLIPDAVARLLKSSKLSSADKALLETTLATGWIKHARASVENLKTDDPALAKTLELKLDQLSRPGGDLLASVDTWFESIMDRSSEVFTLWTRVITAAFAVIIAFAFHIDSIEIIKELSANRELRAQLVAGADTTLQKAVEFQSSVASPADVVAQALAHALDSAPAPERRAPRPIPPAGLTSKRDGEQWLRANVPEPARASAIAAFDRKFDELATAELARLRHQAASLIDDTLSKNFRFLNFERTPFNGFIDDGRHFWGTLMTAVLLSLGAPFWHSMLRNVVSLRPIVAAKLDKESAASAQRSRNDS